MLVLTRKLNQEILIGENVKITVLKVKGNTVSYTHLTLPTIYSV